MSLIIKTIANKAKAIVSGLIFKCEAMHRNATHLITSANDDKPLQAVLPDGIYPVFIVSPFTEHTFMFFVADKNFDALNDIENVMDTYAIKLHDGHRGDWENDDGDTDQAIFAFKHSQSALYNVTPKLKTIKKRKIYTLNDGTIKGERVQMPDDSWVTIGKDDMEPM